MRRSVKIKDTIVDHYLLSEDEVVRSINESVPGKLYEHKEKGQLKNVVVICDPNFMHELITYFHWKERNAQNYLEDIFRISGQIFYDRDKVILVPRFLLKMVSENRSKTSVVTNVVNKQGAEYQNYILSQNIGATAYHWLENFGPLEVIGHGHSHPDLGGIGVNPSSIDVKDHLGNLQDNKLWLSHIVDPIRGLSGFYFGPELKRPKVVYMLYPEDQDLFESKQTTFYRVSPMTTPKHIHTVIPCESDAAEAEEKDDNEKVIPAEMTEMAEPPKNIKPPVDEEQTCKAHNKEKVLCYAISDKKLKKMIRKIAVSYIRSDDFINEIMYRLRGRYN